MDAVHNLANSLKNNFLVALCNGIKEGAAVIEKASGHIIFCNRAWSEVFDINTSDKINLLPVFASRKEKLTDTQLLYRIRIAEEGSFHEQVEYVSKNGKPFWAELIFRAFTNNNKSYYLAVIDRIDNIKESEQRIAQQKQQLEAVLEHACMGILELNKEAEIISINRFGLTLFGYQKEEIINKKIEALIPQTFHAKHLQHRKGYTTHSQSRPMGLGMDLFAVKKDGTEFPVEVSLSTYARNGHQYIIAFINDISIRKKAELEIKKLNDELEEAVEQRTVELKHAIQQLQISKEELSRSLEKEKELGELKSRFVSMASHEFRTPLSTVLSSVYLLEQYNTGEGQPKRERHLKRIISSVNMLTDILNDFLSVGKIEEGKIHVKYTKFDVQKLINSVTEEIKNNLKKEQTIHYTHEGAPEFFLDASLLKHMVMNLISNASKFSPESSRISIHTFAGEREYILSIKDEGIGISEEDQKHLMERFFRATNATNVQGTGLGLHIISKYAELMNGTIQCTSVLQKGTTFIITFSKNDMHYEKNFDH
ncbi:PAS domain-containing sensor histidine kinase [Agriterribacter sp.]|uniref:sensor histidine kinase n=1 Tax=Agriterribacter sp. TaxID=2821509 RepID=UPI002C39CDCB|nr:PAS domain-containing sensor histidine kinase [Agriterribacter sp.]HRP54785.1 PAS domain-containing sensor histidine kinase [Agriterribacter sp.]